ncbi:hypothetical protein [Pareuzebyella sediminis]|nr:hypothetical protein [Pareuzebyella sediminis]
MVRIDNVERYDDRLYCTTNLIDAYDELVELMMEQLREQSEEQLMD